jgi:hypothetical protein
MKPAVGASGRHLSLISMSEVESKMDKLQKMLDEEDFLFQPYLSQVLTKGETSVVFINERYSHSVAKKHTKTFNVSNLKTSVIESPSEKDIMVAMDIIAAAKRHLKKMDIQTRLLYTRVDLLYTEDGLPVLNELELIGTYMCVTPLMNLSEPELYFRYHLPATDMMATALRELCDAEVKDKI